MDKYNNLLQRTSKRYRIYSHLPREVFKYPITLEIFPTNKCNSHCSFCAYSKLRNQEEIPEKVFVKLIKDILNSNINSVSFAGGGEPLIYSDIHKAINYLVDNKIDVGIITNGLFLNQDLIEAIKKCSWIRFSLLCSNSKDYKELTGTSEKNFYIILDNIKKITENSKDNLYVSALYMSNIPNDGWEKVKSFLELSAELHLDQIFFKNIVYSFIQNNTSFDFYSKKANKIIQLADNKKIITNLQKFLSKEESSYKKRLKNKPCQILRFNLIGLINANGDYYPCLYQYVTNGIKYGNINQECLNTILEKREEIVKKLKLLLVNTVVIGH